MSIRSPDCRVEWASQLMPPKVGDVRNALRDPKPAALSWENSPDLQSRLKDAVSKIDIPVFLIQPAKDASLEPAKVLGAILARRNAANRVKVFPAAGPEPQQAHCFGGAPGMHLWGPEAVAFVEAALK